MCWCVAWVCKMPTVQVVIYAFPLFAKRRIRKGILLKTIKDIYTVLEASASEQEIKLVNNAEKELIIIKINDKISVVSFGEKNNKDCYCFLIHIYYHYRKYPIIHEVLISESFDDACDYLLNCTKGHAAYFTEEEIESIGKKNAFQFFFIRNNPLVFLIKLISLLMIIVIAVCMLVIKNLPIGMYVSLFAVGLVLLNIGIISGRERSREVIYFFIPLHKIDAELTPKQRKKDILILIYFFGGLALVIGLWIVHIVPGMTALVLYMAGLGILAYINRNNLNIKDVK